jgi:hypothetical protein
MPCPANPFAHTEGIGAVGIEVKWSCKRTPKGIKTSFYYGCGLCKAQTFLNTWNEAWGFTLPQAEAMGMVLIGLDSTHKDELLRELGLERAAPPPMHMPPPPPPPPPPYRPGPRRPGKKK